MSDQGPRYAIYFAPGADDPLWRFGSQCIGYDAQTGADGAVPQTAAIPQQDWLAWTQEPRRYGFHGTLKAPFHLADGTSEGELIESMAQFASARAAFRLPDIDVRAISQFVAITPLTPKDELQDLARDCVTAFDRFRAPPDEADLARRLSSPLSARQLELLETWGYPYVMEQFRFHMTLTSSLPTVERAIVVAELSRRFRDEVGRTDLLIDGFALFRQGTRDSRFRIIQRFAFNPADTMQAQP
jgi:putative phosphonate metabolism protein